MAHSELLVILQKYLPEGSADYAHDILWKYGIQLRIKKPRATKLGDYRPPQTGEAHRISINKDLNKYAFLVTFLHETAHLINFEKRGFKVQPHGLEWKQEFQVVTKPMLHETILPNDVQGALQRYEVLGRPCALQQFLQHHRRHEHAVRRLQSATQRQVLFGAGGPQVLHPGRGVDQNR